LLAAARFEREAQRDVLAAERHLALAVRLQPRDARIGDAYREVAALVSARLRPQRELEPADVRDQDTGETVPPGPDPEDG
jgi:hypothetical protein